MPRPSPFPDVQHVVPPRSTGLSADLGECRRRQRGDTSRLIDWPATSRHVVQFRGVAGPSWRFDSRPLREQSRDARHFLSRAPPSPDGAGSTSGFAPAADFSPVNAARSPLPFAILTGFGQCLRKPSADELLVLGQSVGSVAERSAARSRASVLDRNCRPAAHPVPIQPLAAKLRRPSWETRRSCDRHADLARGAGGVSA